MNKNPKFWPPSTLQIHNLFGRSTAAIMMFSIPSSFPSVKDLVKFGYIVNENEIKLNLTPTTDKVKNASLLLSSVHKKQNLPKKKLTVKRKNSSDRGRLISSKKKRIPDQLID